MYLVGNQFIIHVMRKSFRLLYFIFAVGLILSFQVKAQRVEIKRIFFQDSKVHVQYDLIDTRTDRSYQIQLYSSKDNFISPLKETRGDVGVEVYSGDNKQIVWDPFAEYGVDFNQKVSLEIRGRVYIPFVKLDDFNYTKLRRGKSYEITWTGGASSNILNIELYKGDNKVALFPNVANVGHYQVLIPKKTQLGKGYRFRISDKNNKDDVVFSNEFAIQRKIPLALQVLPVAVVGAGLYFVIPLLGQSDDGGGIQEPVGPPEED